MPSPPLCLEPGSRSWPSGLERVESPPARLWARGQPEVLASPHRLAIVGSRSASLYGLDQAARFAASIAGQGFTIVSGLARGIDEAGHRAALEVGGATVAVLGSGVDRPWPDGPMTRAVAERGLLLSEYPPGQGPRRQHFPLRNRIIAGLSRAVLVVEAAWSSGSLITARWALDQGKPVFVVPGRVDHPMALGIVRLMREGATPVASPEELLADLLGTPAPIPGSEDRRAPTSCPLARAILEALTGETLTADEVALRVGRGVDAVLVRLIELEIAGDLARSPGGLWRTNPCAARQAKSAPQASMTAATMAHPQR